MRHSNAIYAWARCTLCTNRSREKSKTILRCRKSTVSILAYDAGRPVRHADRISAPDPENARHRRSGRCRALDLQGRWRTLERYAAARALMAEVIAGYPA